MDWTVLVWPLLIFAMVIGLYAQFKVKSAFNRQSQVPLSSGLTGAQVARQILDESGIHDVSVEAIDTYLGDHYDPTKKRLCLSPGVYQSRSVAAAGIAAHECGHAIQHARAYAPLHARMMVVPATMFASQLLPFVIFGGFLLNIFGLIVLGIVIYSIITVFQLITLPVEFNASSRAKQILQKMGIVSRQEAEGVNKVLNAAALTYVAALISAIANLLLLVARARR
jgi:Zn-dependent membrane protease YugP